MAAMKTVDIECPACHDTLCVPCVLNTEGRDEDRIGVAIHPDLTVIRDHAREHEADHG